MDKQDRIEVARAIVAELFESQLTFGLKLLELKDLIATDEPVQQRRQSLPRLDGAIFCLLWKRRRCSLGHTTSYRLMERLLRRTNQYVSHARLCDDVWHGEERSAETIRSAVRQLRLKLVASGMHDLAKAIRAEGRHYGLILRRD